MKLNTSALIAELLLAGGLVELGALLALDQLAAGAVLAWLVSINGTEFALAASGALVLSYYLGSLLNAFSRMLFRPLEQRVKKKILGPLSSEENLRRRLHVLAESPFLNDYIEELYAQIRIFRSASVGFGAVALILVCRQAPRGDIKAFLVVAALFIALGSIAAMINATRSYFRVQRAAWENLSGKTTS